MEQQTLAPSTTSNSDMLRTLLHIRVAKQYATELLSKNPDANVSIKTGVFRTVREINELERKILNKTDNQFPWLRKEVEKDKLWDIGLIVDLITRIGHEESEERYEEFLGLLTDTISTVFYMQTNRSNINFEKYKALFKLITDEIKADTNDGIPNILFRKGELVMRLDRRVQEQEIKLT